MARNRLHQLAQFRDYAAIAEAAPGIEPNDQKSVLPDTHSPCQQMSRIFEFQSYFDNTLLQTAILSQRRNSPIVESTAKEEQVPGYAIGLHPSSQTPIALQFKIGGQPTSSQAIILKPGMVVRPHGLPRDKKTGSFSGFVWGLPFGWLGGGLATILVFQTPDADVAWPGNPEVIFHRTRMQITNAAGLPAGIAPKNWPTRFPWTQAFQGASSVSQQGTSQIAVEPTKVIMRLRLASLAAANTMRIVFQETNDFDLDSAGAVIATPAGFVEQVWGTYAAAGGAGNLSTQYPYIILGQDVTRLAAENGGVVLQDMTGGLVNQYIDVVRYGRL